MKETMLLEKFYKMITFTLLGFLVLIMFAQIEHIFGGTKVLHLIEKILEKAVMVFVDVLYAIYKVIDKTF